MQYQYMIRIEIHHANGEQYDRLHVAAAAEGLNRILTAEGTNKKSKMPIGTYWLESSRDAWTVLEAAKRAALQIDPSAEIVVAGGPQIVYYNCPDVNTVLPVPAVFGLGGLTRPTRRMSPPPVMAGTRDDGPYLRALMGLGMPPSPKRGSFRF